MENKVVVITGSSSGIGAKTAIAFAKEGAILVIHGTNSLRLNSVANECEQASPSNNRPSTVEADFSSEAGPEKLASFVKKNYNSLDVLINNAGSFKDFTCLKSDSYEEFKRSMQVNFNSAVQLTTSLVPMLQNSTGCIVNVSSNLAIKPSYGTYAYSAAKAALRAFTKSLSIELAPLVRVNSVSPGPISTLMAPRLGMSDELFRKTVGKDSLVGRVGEADEVASVILFLVSNESKFITGSDILVDGGCLLKPSGVIMGTG